MANGDSAVQYGNGSNLGKTNLIDSKTNAFDVAANEALTQYEEELVTRLKKLKETVIEAKDAWDKIKEDATKSRGEKGAKKGEWRKAVQKLKDFQDTYKDKLDEISKKQDKINETRGKGLTFEDKILKKLKEQGVQVELLATGWGEIKNGISEISGKVKGFADAWGEVDQAAADYTKHIGGNINTLNQLRTHTINLVRDNNTAIRFGAGMKDIIELQEGYNKAVGRSVSLTDSHIESLAAMRKMAGDEVSIQMADKLQNFGLNPDDAGDMIGKIYGDSARKGLAFEKVTKNFLENIRLAQSYSFANGLNGLRAMAEKATAIRLDLQQTASFADKVSTVEGALQSAAGLSVLGGPFAQFGNPMQMLYEGLNDMEALQDRIINMFGSLASFDSATGEMRVSSFDKQRIRAAAQQTGLNYDDLMTSIHAQGMRNHISGQVEAMANGNKDLEELLYNTAFMKNGIGYVTVNDENGNPKDKAISGLTKEDIDQLRITHGSETDNIKTIAETIIGWNDFIKGTQEQMKNLRADVADLVMPKVKEMGVSLVNQTWILGSILGTTAIISTAVAASKISSGIGNIAKSMAGGNGVIGKVGKSMTSSPFKWKFGAGAAAGGLLAGAATGLNEVYGNNHHTNGEKVTRTAASTIGAGIGAGLGAMIPFVGPIAAPLLGTLGAWGGDAIADIFYKDTDQKAENILRELRDNYGYTLKNPYNYNIDELQTISRGRSAVNADQKLVDKIMNNEDKFPGWATGGRVSGFGSEKSDSIIARVSNGEHIINANSAHANRDLLNLINASNGKNVMTSGLLPQVSISRSKNALNQMVVKPSSTIGNLSSSSQSSVPTSIDFNMKPIEIRFSREPIKVDLGSNKISEIDLSNISPALMKRLSDDIGKQLINQVSMGFNKEKYWKKFGV